MPLRNRSARPPLRLIARQHAAAARSQVERITRTQEYVASARQFSPTACVDLTIALGECPDLLRREHLEARRDRFVIALLIELLELGEITAATCLAAVGAVAVASRLDDLRHRIESSGLLLAAQLTAAIEAAELPREVECFLFEMQLIELDPVAWGVDTTADRMVHAIAGLDAGLVPFVGLHASLIFGAPETIDGFEQRERERRQRAERMGADRAVS